MKKTYSTLIAAGALLCATASPGATQTPHPVACFKNAADADLIQQRYQTGLMGDTLITLLYGNTKAAINNLGNELAMEVQVLDAIRKNPVCGVSKDEVARIYPMLRVIAAINRTKPIPNINNNKKVMAILDQAVKADPDHYQQLLKRAKHWQNGIN